MDKAVYIVFSATPTTMGRLIRLTTRNPYNHTSISLEADIHTLYSFARYHRTIPLYGGFVEESILRYSSFAGLAKVKICRLPLDELQCACLSNDLKQMWTNRQEYIYNTPAAVASLVRFPISIPKAHTCVSFVYDLLVRCHLIPAQPRGGPSLEELEHLLANYVVYEGPVPHLDGTNWGSDDFLSQTSTCYAVYATARHFGRLTMRAFLRRA